MKQKLIAWLSVFLIFTACKGPQKTAGVSDAEAPIGSTHIVVETSSSPTEAYRRTAKILQQQGFALANSDSELFSITTEPKTGTDILGPVRDMRVSVMVRDDPTRVVLSGTVESQQIRKYGQRGSPMRKAWARLHQIAAEFGGSVEYSGADQSP